MRENLSTSGVSSTNSPSASSYGRLTRGSNQSDLRSQSNKTSIRTQNFQYPLEGGSSTAPVVRESLGSSRGEEVLRSKSILDWLPNKRIEKLRQHRKLAREAYQDIGRAPRPLRVYDKGIYHLKNETVGSAAQNVGERVPCVASRR